MKERIKFYMVPNSVGHDVSVMFRTAIIVVVLAFFAMLLMGSSQEVTSYTVLRVTLNRKRSDAREAKEALDGSDEDVEVSLLLYNEEAARSLDIHVEKGFFKADAHRRLSQALDPLSYEEGFWGSRRVLVSPIDSKSQILVGQKLFGAPRIIAVEETFEIASGGSISNCDLDKLAGQTDVIEEFQQLYQMIKPKLNRGDSIVVRFYCDSNKSEGRGYVQLVDVIEKGGK